MVGWYLSWIDVDAYTSMVGGCDITHLFVVVIGKHEEYEHLSATKLVHY